MKKKTLVGVNGINVFKKQICQKITNYAWNIQRIRQLNINTLAGGGRKSYGDSDKKTKTDKSIIKGDTQNVVCFSENSKTASTDKNNKYNKKILKFFTHYLISS